MDTPIVVRYSFLSLSLDTATPTIETNTFRISITHVTGERGRREEGEREREEGGGEERERREGVRGVKMKPAILCYEYY